jgi:hypothetical protein
MKGAFGPPVLLKQYAERLPIIQRVARECGYAIGLHGSGQRDLDLIAVPWVVEAKPAAELIEAVRAAIDGVIVDYENVERNPAYRPHGRLAWSIQIGGGLYVDLSVTPHVQPA